MVFVMTRLHLKEVVLLIKHMCVRPPRKLGKIRPVRKGGSKRTFAKRQRRLSVPSRRSASDVKPRRSVGVVRSKQRPIERFEKQKPQSGQPGEQRSRALRYGLLRNVRNPQIQVLHRLDRRVAVTSR